MFKRRRSRISGRKPRRQTNWTGLIFQGSRVELTAAGTQGYNGADIATAWSVWPSGSLTSAINQVDSAVAVVTPEDTTVVRTIHSGQITYDLQGLTQDYRPLNLYVAGIAWDSQEPEHEHGNILQWPEIPHPADPSQEWLFRVPVCMTVDNFVTNYAVEPWVDTRAMRKLPRSTGILVLVGLADFLNDGSTSEVGWSLDVRHLLKAGNYSPV